MRPINAKAIFYIAIAISIVILLIAQDNPYQNILITISLILISISFLLLVVFWRCPKCKKFLPAREFFVEYCPHCGDKIN